MLLEPKISDKQNSGFKAAVPMTCHTQERDASGLRYFHYWP